MDKIEQRRQERREAKNKEMESINAEGVESVDKEEEISKKFSLVDTNEERLMRSRYVEVCVDDITESFDYQVRKTFDEELINNISGSIERDGFFQNLVLIEIKSGKYKLVAGETRYKALVKAQVPYAMAYVFPQNTSIEKLLKISLGENFNRKQPHGFEQYLLLKQLLNDGLAKTYRELAEATGGIISESNIKKLMSYEEVPEVFREDAHKGVFVNVKITVAAKSAIRRLKKKFTDISKEEIENNYIIPIYEKLKSGQISSESAMVSYEKMGKDILENSAALKKTKTEYTIKLSHLSIKKREELDALLEDFLKDT